MEKDKILIGEIYREHGIQGRVRVFVYSGTSENFRPGMKIYLENKAGEGKQAVIKTAVPYQKWFLTQFSVFETPEEAKAWRKARVYISKKDLKESEKGESYVFELIGFEVVDLQGKKVGTIREMRGVGVTALFVLEAQDGSERLIPVVPQWIVSKDEKGKKIVMDLPEGL